MPTEIIVAFSIGSNIGAREERVLEGAARLGRTPGLRELELGVLYETRPVGRGYGRSFVNTACIARTALEPRALLGRCEEIERLAGRAAKGRGADRTLDTISFSTALSFSTSRGSSSRIRAWPSGSSSSCPSPASPPTCPFPPGGRRSRRSPRDSRTPTGAGSCPAGSARREPLERQTVQLILTRPPFFTTVGAMDGFRDTLLAGDIRHIAIEGNIGAGKTTLARLVAEASGARLFLEEVDDNPFIERYYGDMQEYAFQAQIFFLLNRYRQQQEIA
ncbi:MAG TPA: hypothetical protein ENO08_02495, partial [Candidatus Eisenbacteria bacterium]|nr:hypothetical protein [Candidatus Eisenbacteria bacterium]